MYMPGRNTIKTYIENTYYHLYNRGVEKQKIFRDDQDHAVFLSYLKTYLEPKDEISLQQIISDTERSWREKDQAIKLLRLNNFSDTITLLSYCLMSNHFHFLVKQTESNAIDHFMNSLCTRFTMYFNKKYKRVGPLFQSVYKAVMIRNNEQLFHITRYIHKNPIAHMRADRIEHRLLASFSYSSYQEYLGLRKTTWVKCESVLTQFLEKGLLSYQSFVEDVDQEENMQRMIQSISLD